MSLYYAFSLMGSLAVGWNSTHTFRAIPCVRDCIVYYEKNRLDIPSWFNILIYNMPHNKNNFFLWFMIYVRFSDSVFVSKCMLLGCKVHFYRNIVSLYNECVSLYPCVISTNWCCLFLSDHHFIFSVPCFPCSAVYTLKTNFRLQFSDINRKNKQRTVHGMKLVTLMHCASIHICTAL